MERNMDDSPMLSDEEYLQYQMELAAQQELEDLHDAWIDDLQARYPAPICDDCNEEMILVTVEYPTDEYLGDKPFGWILWSCLECDAEASTRIEKGVM